MGTDTMATEKDKQTAREGVRALANFMAENICASESIIGLIADGEIDIIDAYEIYMNTPLDD